MIANAIHFRYSYGLQKLADIPSKLGAPSHLEQLISKLFCENQANSLKYLELFDLVFQKWDGLNGTVSPTLPFSPTP